MVMARMFSELFMVLKGLCYFQDDFHMRQMYDFVCVLLKSSKIDVFFTGTT